jgi:KipI family sensor histidine kinase inhibitor
VGERALSVEFGRELDLAAAARVRALDAQLTERPPRGFVEAVPCCASLLVVYDPTCITFDELVAELRERSTARVPPSAAARLHELDVHYGGDDGPDLEPLAEALNLTPTQLVEQHTATTYTVLMLGFLPGFAYLGLLPEALACRRHASPRTRVPAGSVGLAGRQTGIYPRASPGGWQIIGRSSACLFDAHAQPPQRLRAGDRVRLRACRLDERGHDTRPVAATHPVSACASLVEVLEPGWSTTVQAQPRVGWRRCGVPGAGALDSDALACANQALGNAHTLPALELCTPGARLRLRGRACRIAWAGADLGARLERADLGAWAVPAGQAVLMRPGNVLSFEARRIGLRAYLAFEGGLDIAPVLGSTSTDVTAGFGGWQGRALQRGDVLGVRGLEPTGVRSSGPAAVVESPDELWLRVVLGPQDDLFAPHALRAFLESAWQVTAASDRVGCRLQGPVLDHEGGGAMLSDGLMPGCVQVPPDGQPIVTLADGPTTGGYPKIATVLQADLSRLAQALPGVTHVRFTALTVQEAQRVRSWEVRRSFVASSGLP